MVGIPERHSAEELRSLSNDDLAARVIDYTGQAGPKAEAEMSRRLIVALQESKASADRWAFTIAVLTVVLIALTVVLIAHGG